MTRYIACVLALIALGCGGSGGGPAAPNAPQYPNIGGTYNSNTLWQIRFQRVSDGASAEVACSGSITFSQSGGTFGGSFIMGAPCDPTSGSVVQGTVRMDGGVSFDTQVPGADPNALSALTGCTITSASGLYTGNVAGNSLQASASATLACATGTIAATARIIGTR